MTIFTKKSLGTLFALSLFFFLVLVTITNAQAPTYTPLVGIPGITDLKTASLGEYLNAIYLLLISVGGLIGVVKLSMAGVKYSMSDVVTDKGEAKKDILGVLLGLAILLIPFVVLNTIYPNLTNLDVLKLKDADKIRLEPSRANIGGTAGGGGGSGTGTDFLSSLPKPPFNASGFCTEKFKGASEEWNYGECEATCEAVCKARGGDFKVSSQDARGCNIGHCAKE